MAVWNFDCGLLSPFSRLLLFSMRTEPPFAGGWRRSNSQLRAERRNLKQARILHLQCSQYNTGRCRSCWGSGDYAGGAPRMGERARNEASQGELQIDPSAFPLKNALFRFVSTRISNYFRPFFVRNARWVSERALSPVIIWPILCHFRVEYLSTMLLSFFSHFSTNFRNICFRNFNLLNFSRKFRINFISFAKRAGVVNRTACRRKKVIFFVEFRDVETSSISREKNREKGAREKLQTSRGPSLIGLAVKFKT